MFDNFVVATTDASVAQTMLQPFNVTSSCVLKLNQTNESLGLMREYLLEISYVAIAITMTKILHINYCSHADSIMEFHQIATYLQYLSMLAILSSTNQLTSLKLPSYHAGLH